MHRFIYTIFPQNMYVCFYALKMNSNEIKLFADGCRSKLY